MVLQCDLHHLCASVSSLYNIAVLRGKSDRCSPVCENQGVPVKTSRQRATATDVARASNVSQATVSYVMNNTPGQTISQSTRERVLEAANRLGYVPNASAQILAGGRSRFVIIAMGDLPLGELVSRSERMTMDDLLVHGFIPVMSETGGTGDHGPLIALAVALRPAAIITLAPITGAEVAELQGNGAPRLLSVYPDLNELFRAVSETGGVQASHLADRGHRVIAFARSAEAGLEKLVDARLRGVESAAELRGLEIAASISWDEDLPTLVEELRRLLEARPEVTAIAAYNDEVALAVCAAARALGVAVPSQLAVMGADNLQMGELVSPSLSSVRYDFAGLMATSFGRLLTTDEPAPRSPDISISVVPREST